ncbi:MAG: Ku protein [Candidatus Babeliales bacterium]
MKSIWSGTISFGLVQIPIQLLSAIQAHRFGFKILHSMCNTPLSYERWCPHCNKKVAWDDAVKGLPTGEGSYYVFSQEDIKELKPERTDTIDIISFVNRDLVPDIYLDSHFYIAPDRKSSKSFFLFMQALADTGLVAIGRFVMRDKDYMCLIEPYEDGLLLTTLNYDYEIRPLEDVPALKKAPKLTQSEVNLAKQLIKQMTKKKFDISKYKDTFVEQLRKELKSKKRTAPKGTRKTKLKVPERHKEDLITALKGSLQAPARERSAAYAKRSTKTVAKRAPAKRVMRKKVTKTSPKRRKVRS